MLNDILFALWFFVPAGAANVMPVLIAKVPFLQKYNAPIDGGRMWRGKRVFGDHKTWRGLISGMIAGTLALWLQQYLIGNSDSLAEIVTGRVDYAALPTLLVGPLFGIGALGGDAIESFFKRQRGIAPGKSWFPFDQTDYIIGGAIATYPFVTLSLGDYAWLLFVWLTVHVTSTVLGYYLGFKDQPI
jgi:CDP-2,3-bis-(O-geranylgeranyl)-sn-glycerol synthase